jgi:hypothetical protein
MCHLHNRVLLIGITCPSSNLSQIICHPYITESTKRNYLFIIKSTSSWIVYIAQSSKYELLVHHLVSSSMLSQSHSCHLPCCHSHTLVIFHVVTIALLSYSMLSHSHFCHLPCCHSRTLVIFHVVTVALLSSSMLSQSHSYHLPCCHSRTLVIFHVVTVALLSSSMLSQSHSCHLPCCHSRTLVKPHFFLLHFMGFNQILPPYFSTPASIDL